LKRAGGLWHKITSFDNLLAASRAARRAKRFKPNVLKFEHNLEYELLRLQEELVSKTYRPGPYREFYIHEPKRRKISAAPYRDRVVHHALVRVVEPVFERSFIYHSYACRRMKGTHRAVDAFERFLRAHEWCLKMDVEKFFPSIDHAILKGVVAQKIKCRDTLRLVALIIDGANEQEHIERWFPGDGLFTPAERRRGIPIGNLTSQFLANVMLDPLDHFVNETLRIGAYVRYCDDFALFADSKAVLREARQRITAFLQSLRLVPHPRKCHIFPARRGSPFLGYRVLRTHRRLLPEKITPLRRRILEKVDAYRAGGLTREKLVASLAAWEGHVRHAASGGLKRSLHSQLYNYMVSSRESGGRRLRG